MRKFFVTIVLKVRVRNKSEAFEWGVSAAEHLADTFNDDHNIDPLVQVLSTPCPEPSNAPSTPSAN